METGHFWEDNGQSVKYDNYNSNDGFGRVGGDQLNFAAPSEDEAEYPPGAYLKKGKVSRQDPLSHRIIEKRRRDRMNNCLADLSRLIPPEYLKKGRGRVEKTEIIEMAIRHLKYLQDRANAGDRQSEQAFRAGYQEAVGEAVRFLVEGQGYERGDGLCVALASYLQRRFEGVANGENNAREHAPNHPGGSSSETSSSSSHGYTVKPGVITQVPPPMPAFSEHYEPLQEAYAMECDRVPVSHIPEGPNGDLEPLPLDDRRKTSPTLRAVRKPEHNEDYLHSYKFKNSIERRFSRSQDEAACATNMTRSSNLHTQNKLYSHKRRRGVRPPVSAPSSTTETSTSASASTEETRDTSPQDTSNESSHYHHHYDKPQQLPSQYVPVFALNEIGKYYVPLNVEYACLVRQGVQSSLTQQAAQLSPPLHPVSIHVNFHACVDCQVKREPNDREWRPAN